MTKKHYTANELARTVSRTSGLEVTGRTVHYYRSIDALSPCVRVGNQLKFTDRHVKELLALLNLTGTRGQPRLYEIGKEVPLMSNDDLVKASLPGGLSQPEKTDPQFFCLEAPGSRTIPVTPDLSLVVSESVDHDTITDLLRVIDEYLKNPKEDPK